MKKIFVAFLLMLMPVSAFAAFGNVWRSSYTITADTAKSLCSDVNTGKRKGVLHSVFVGTSAAGTISIYNSYNTAANQVSLICSTCAVISGPILFDVDMSSGIVYTNSTAGTGVTFTYQCD